MHSPRRTYVVSLYNEDKSVIVEAVQREERARLDDLDGLAARIRQWEDEDAASAGRPSTSGTASAGSPSGGSGA